jgi:hypothetical protein
LKNARIASRVPFAPSVLPPVEKLISAAIRFRSEPVGFRSAHGFDPKRRSFQQSAMSFGVIAWPAKTRDMAKIRVHYGNRQGGNADD